MAGYGGREFRHGMSLVFGLSDIEDNGNSQTCSVTTRRLRGMLKCEEVLTVDSGALGVGLGTAHFFAGGLLETMVRVTVGHEPARDEPDLEVKLAQTVGTRTGGV